MPTRTQQAELQRIASGLQRAETLNDADTQLDLYLQLARLTPNVALVHAQIAHLALDKGEEALARPHVFKALAQQPDIAVDALLFQHLCKLPTYTSELDQARAWFEAQPNLWRFKLFYEALQANDSTHELEPLLLRMLRTSLTANEQSQLMTLLGQRYYEEARFHDAVGCYRLGLELTPGNQTQLFNLGTALEQLGRYVEAVDFYKKVLLIDASNPGIHNNLGIVMLRLGEYEQGWKQYEWRWKSSQLEHEQIFNIPRWRGEALDGKSLLVWGEQGIGDHIMFSSMLNELRARGGTLHYEIYARLDPLFERSFPGMTFLRRETVGEAEQNGQQMFKQKWPKADFQIPMGSLGTVFRNDAASFGDAAPYLEADNQLVEEFKAKYSMMFPGKRLIGLSWRGGKALHTERQSRRVSFADLGLLSQLKNVQFIDLQYDSTPEDRLALQQQGLAIYRDESFDPTSMMDAPAAQMCALEAIISVDNSTVHLAGALGVPVYALIQLNPNWRWGLKEGPSIWYSSVNVFRNPRITDWQEPLQRIIAALKRRPG